MNSFSGIISADFKALFVDVISALMYDDACTIPCTISYGITKYEDCANCVFDPIGNKSANRYQSGGPLPFPFGGICPMCNGNGKRGVESSETINLMVIFDYKDFINKNTINYEPNDMIQTITFDENTPKLRRAKDIIVATNIASYGRHRFERYSEPQPCGLGGTDFVECVWKRSG